MRIAVVVGNPKPQSRTLDASMMLARRIGGGEPDLVIDLATVGPDLLAFGSQTVADAIAAVRATDLVIFGSPTYKATYTGVLKLFLDQFPPDGLGGIVAIPLMLGAGPAHALAPELHLKPVLAELGAVCPTPGLYLNDKTYAEDARLGPFVERLRANLPARLAAPQ